MELVPSLTTDVRTTQFLNFNPQNPAFSGLSGPPILVPPKKNIICMKKIKFCKICRAEMKFLVNSLQNHGTP